MHLNEAINGQYHYIIVSCDAQKERDGLSELWHALYEYCNIQPIEAFELPIKGLFIVAISEDPREVILQIKEIIEGNRFEFLICKKFTPIERIIKSDLELLLQLIPEYMKKVPKEAIWRISFKRRHTKLSRTKIIESIASLPNAPKGKVDLVNPEWEIIIELFSNWIGFSVYPSDSIISIEAI